MTAPHLDPDEVILVPKTFLHPELEQDVVNRYKKLRLHGLRVDPQSFSSTYEDESQFPDSTWLSRIYNPVGKTFAAVTNSNNQPEASTDKIPFHTMDTKDTFQRLLRKEWVGIVTLLGPGVFSRPNESVAIGLNQPYEVFIRDKKYQIPLTTSELGDLSGAHLVYLIVGMFVSPSARRRGHGQRLMDAVLAAAADEACMLGARKVSITVQVESGNLGAKRLYERVGFKVVDEGVVIENRLGAKSTVVCLEMEVDIASLEPNVS
jgi:GNAT superfamily N-acetyltransferase